MSSIMEILTLNKIEEKLLLSVLVYRVITPEHCNQYWRRISMVHATNSYERVSDSAYDKRRHLLQHSKNRSLNWLTGLRFAGHS